MDCIVLTYRLKWGLCRRSLCAAQLASGLTGGYRADGKEPVCHPGTREDARDEASLETPALTGWTGSADSVCCIGETRDR